MIDLTTYTIKKNDNVGWKRAQKSKQKNGSTIEINRLKEQNMV
jgi:hypothetical protein